jgi:hypothetical protein
MVPPPVVKNGTVTYNSTYAKDIPNRNTAKSIFQYGHLVVGIVEFYLVAGTATPGNYLLFTIGNVSMPSSAVYGTCTQLNDFATYGMDMPSITVNTNGTVTFNIQTMAFIAGYSFAISFNYLT